MKSLIAALALLFGAIAPLGAQAPTAPKPADGGFAIKLTGNFYVAPQIWPDIGADDDSKLGFGLGGMFGAALLIDDIRFQIGPHIAYNMWTADYSSKPNSATRSVTFAMEDVGLEMALGSGNFSIMLGKGTSTMDASMVLESGSTFTYPGLDGAKFDYNKVGVGMKFKKFNFMLAHTSYPDAAKDASRNELRIGLGF